MKNFFINAILGVAVVQGVTVSTMSQCASTAMISSDISSGDSVFLNCPYNDNRKDRVHTRAHVTIDGMQTATADDKVDDPVTMWFSFEDMGLKDNTIRGRLYSATGLEARKASRTCELPTITPSFITTVTGSNTDKTENVNFQADIPGATFSIFSKKDVL